MSELREDPLTGATVLLATGRAARPYTHRSRRATPDGADDATVAACPFCAGNEHMTPPEVARLGAGEENAPGWQVRVVPNLYPIVGAGGGAHEVVVLSPSHALGFDALDDRAAAAVFTVLRDRSAMHLAAGLQHAQPFLNVGRAAGASIEHPHAQLVALPFVPPAVVRLQQRFIDAANDLVATEIETHRGSEYALIDDTAFAWCPPAARSPFETRVSAVTAGARFDRATNEEVARVASAVRRTVAAVAAVLDEPAYNVVVHTAAAGVERGYHWWVQITPRVSVTAGFEDGTGVLVNTVNPEVAAGALRAAMADAPP